MQLNMNKDNQVQLSSEDSKKVSREIEKQIRERYKKFKSFNLNHILLLKDNHILVQGENTWFNLFGTNGEPIEVISHAYIGAFSFSDIDYSTDKATFTKLKKLTMRRGGDK